MRIISFLLLSAFLAVMSSVAPAAEPTQTHVRALLVIASKQPGASERPLAPYEPTLRRILRFESFRLMGEGSTLLAIPGGAKIGLSNGHALELTSNGKPGHLGVNWQSNGRSLMNTGLSLRPGVPAVLGGPASGKEGEVWAVILIQD